MKIGDKIYIDGYTSMAQGNARESKIDLIETRYDELTGLPFEIVLVDGEWYDSRDGGCYSNKNSVYYVIFSNENNEATTNLKLDKMNDEFHKKVKKDSWGNGIPMIYMDSNGHIVSHWENDTIDILDKTNPLIKQKFHLDVSNSLPVEVEVVFVSTNGYVTVKYLSPPKKTFERYSMNDFKSIAIIK